MAGQDIRFNMQITADTAQAKKSLAELNQILLSLSKPKSKSENQVVDTKNINEATQAAKELHEHLQKATNVNTGQLNLQAFERSLSKSKKSLSQYADNLISLGSKGEKAFLALAKSIANAEAPLKKGNALLKQWGQTLSNTVKWELSSKLVHSFESAFSNAIHYAKSLNSSLNDIRIVTGASTEEMARFAIQANKAARELSTTTKAYTDASLIYYQQGDSAEQAAKKAAITIKAANASFGTSAEEMSEYLTSVWNSFQVGAEELERYVDIMAVLGAKTATSLEEIATSMQKVAATANTVGVSMEQVSSIIATVSSVTRESAESIGTSFKTIFARMGDLKLGETLEDGIGLGQVSSALSSIGVNVLDATGNLRDMGDIIEDLGSKWQTLNEGQKAAIAQVVAGKRQYTQLMALMENWDTYQQNVSYAKNADGALDEMADTYAESWAAASKRVTAALEEMYSVLIDDQKMTKFVDFLEKTIGTITSMIKTMGGLPGLLQTIGGGMLTAFGPQIAGKIATVGTNIKNAFTGNNYQKASNNLISELSQFAGTDSVISNPSDQMELEMTIKITEAKQKLAEQSKFLTEDQINERMGLINSYRDEMELLIKIAALEEKKSEQNYKIFDEAAEEAIAEKAEKKIDFSKSSDESKRKAKRAAEQEIVAKLKLDTKDASSKLKSLNGTFKKLNWKIDTSQSFKSLRDDLAQVATVIKNTRDAQNEFTKAFEKKTAATVTPEDVTLLNQYADKFDQLAAGSGVEAMTKQAEAINQARKQVMENPGDQAALMSYFDAIKAGFSNTASQVTAQSTTLKQAIMEMYNVGENEAQGMIEKLEKLNEETKDLSQNVKDVEGKLKGLDKTNGFQNITTSVTQFVGVVSQAWAAVNAITNAIGIWTDENATAQEKIGAVISVVTTLVPALLSAGSAGATAFQLFGNAAKAATPGVWGLTAATWAWLAPLLIVAGLIAGVVLLSKLLANNKKQEMLPKDSESQIEEVNNAIAETNEELEETRDSAERLRTEFDHYSSVVEWLQSCVAGTQEWRDAMKKVNEETRNLLLNNPEIRDIINHPEKYSGYYKRVTGNDGELTGDLLYNADGSLNVELLYGISDLYLEDEENRLTVELGILNEIEQGLSTRKAGFDEYDAWVEDDEEGITYAAVNAYQYGDLDDKISTAQYFSDMDFAKQVQADVGYSKFNLDKKYDQEYWGKIAASHYYGYVLNSGQTIGADSVLSYINAYNGTLDANNNPLGAGKALQNIGIVTVDNKGNYIVDEERLFELYPEVFQLNARQNSTNQKQVVGGYYSSTASGIVDEYGTGLTPAQYTAYTKGAINLLDDYVNENLETYQVSGGQLVISNPDPNVEDIVLINADGSQNRNATTGTYWAAIQEYVENSGILEKGETFDIGEVKAGSTGIVYGETDLPLNQITAEYNSRVLADDMYLDEAFRRGVYDTMAGYEDTARAASSGDTLYAHDLFLNAGQIDNLPGYMQTDIIEHLDDYQALGIYDNFASPIFQEGYDPTSALDFWEESVGTYGESATKLTADQINTLDNFDEYTRKKILGWIDAEAGKTVDLLFDENGVFNANVIGDEQLNQHLYNIKSGTYTGEIVSMMGSSNEAEKVSLLNDLISGETLSDEDYEKIANLTLPLEEGLYRTAEGWRYVGDASNEVIFQMLKDANVLDELFKDINKNYVFDKDNTLESYVTAEDFDWTNAANNPLIQWLQLYTGFEDIEGLQEYVASLGSDSWDAINSDFAQQNIIAQEGGFEVSGMDLIPFLDVVENSDQLESLIEDGLVTWSEIPKTIQKSTIENIAEGEGYDLEDLSAYHLGDITNVQDYQRAKQSYELANLTTYADDMDALNSALNQYGSFEAAGAMDQIAEIATALSVFSGVDISPEMVVKNWELFSNIFASGEDGIKQWGAMMQELNDIEDFPWEQFMEVDWSDPSSVYAFTDSLGDSANSVSRVFDYLADSATSAANALSTIEGANMLFQDRAEIASTIMESGEVTQDQYYEIIKAISEGSGMTEKEAYQWANEKFSATSRGTYALTDSDDAQLIANILYGSGLKGYDQADEYYNEDLTFPEGVTFTPKNVKVEVEDGGTAGGVSNNEGAETWQKVQTIDFSGLKDYEEAFNYIATLDPSRVSAAGGPNLTASQLEALPGLFDLNDDSEQYKYLNEYDLLDIPWKDLFNTATYLHGEDKQISDEAREDAELTGMQSNWESYGLDPNEVETYAEYLVETNQILDEQGNIVTEVTNRGREYAAGLLRQQQGMDKAADSLEDWNKELRKGDKNSKTYVDALEGMRDAYGDIFNLTADAEDDLSTGFLESAENAELLEKAINGDIDAYDELEARIAKDITKDMSIFSKGDYEDGEQITQQGIEEIESFLDYVANLEVDDIQIGAEVTDDKFLEDLNSMVFDSYDAAQRMSDALSTMGVDATVTEHKLWVPPENSVIDYSGFTPIYGPNGELLGYENVDSRVEMDSGGYWQTYYTLEGAKYNGKGVGHNTTSKKGSGGGGGGGGGGGKAPEKKREDDVDPYHEIERSLQNLEEQYEEIDRTKESTFGKKHLKAIENEIKLIDKQISKYGELADIAKTEVAKSKEEIEKTLAEINESSGLNLSFTYDANGEISNWYEVQSAIKEWYDNKATGDWTEGFEKLWDLLDEQIGEYESHMDKAAEAEAERQAKIIERSAKKLESITYTIEIDAEIDDSLQAFLDYLNGKWEEDLGKQADVLKNVMTGLENAVGDVDMFSTKLGELQEAYSKGELTQADFVEGLKLLQEEILSNLEDIEDYKKQVAEAYSKSLDIAKEDLERFLSIMEHGSSVMDHYIEILGLIGEGENNAAKQQFYDDRYVHDLAGIEAVKSNLEVLKAQDEAFKQRVENGETLSEEEQQHWEDLKDAIIESEEELLSKTTETLNNLKEAYENEIKVIMETLDAALGGSYGSVDSMRQQYDYFLEQQDRYIDGATELYEVSKLNRKIEQSLADITSTAGKARLKALQDEIDLKSESSKLTEYDIEMMNLKYEKTLAQIALEEAQNAKDTVRLTRDADGNYVYQYTANEDKVADAQQKYEDLLQDINTLAKERARELEDAFISAQESYLSRLDQINSDTTLSEEEKIEARERALEEYKETLDYISEQYGIAQEDYLNNSEEIFSHYGDNIGKIVGSTKNALSKTIGEMITDTTNFKDAATFACDDMVTAWDKYAKKIKEVRDSADVNLKDMKDRTKELKESTDDATKGVKDLNKALGDSLKNIDETTKRFNALAESIDTAVGSYEDLYRTTQKLIEDTANEEDKEETPPTTSGPTEEEEKEEENTQTGIGTYKLNRGTMNLRSGPSINSKDIGTIKGPAEYTYSKEENGWVYIDELGGWTKGNYKTYASITPFDTGGYTGDWAGEAGRLAMLHKKELVLNAEDTQNILEAVEESRAGGSYDEFRHTVVNRLNDIRHTGESILNMLNTYIKERVANFFNSSEISANSLTPDISTATESTTIEQTVQINAEFPNVTDKNEIQEALENMANAASQYVLRSH